MIGVIIWSLAVFAVFLLLKKPYYYGIFISWKRRNKDRFLKWWETLSGLKQIYLFISGIISVILIILFIALCSQIILLPFGKSNIDSINSNFALAFLGTISGGVALFGGFIAILRSETNERQTYTEEQGMITDRINKAVEGLGKNNEKGNPVIEIRLGALYALERIAKDSIRDHVQIMEIICAYVRHNRPLLDKIIPVSEDIQAALTIIGRRDQWPDAKKRLKREKQQGYRIDLRNCNLYRAQLRRANLIGAWLRGSNLTYAVLTNANMSNAWLNGVTLNHALLTNTKTDKSYAWRGDFSDCRNLTQKQLDVMYCGKNLEIPRMDGDKKLFRPKHWPTKNMTWSEFEKSYYEWKDKK